MTDLGYSTRWCCDRHGEEIDFALFGVGDIWGDEAPCQWRWIYVTGGPEDDDRERKVKDRKGLIKALVEWRQNTYKTNPIGFLYEIQDIIDEDGIGLIAKVSPSQLQRDGSDVITAVLEETAKWNSRHARGMFEVISKYDGNGSSGPPTSK